ncbi:MAG: 1-acyl-sn-glycerol-3-phosphate acyltransferase [Bacteroidales bacterium]|nr:1-acyl-sn-glycerol-3-phosphate acyltransferase [Bacteroidales bacterium]
MKVVDEKDFEAISPFFRGEKGHRRARFVMKLLAIDKVNNVYSKNGSYKGAGFASRLLNDLGVNYLIGNAERLKILPKGAFITISNHPYGGLDGIILIDLMASLRTDYKLMVNKILSLVKTMKDNFISVTPVGNKKTGITSTSISGIRETLNHLHEGHPVGFFPSGAVSDFRLKNCKIRDRKWQESILHLIRSAKVPVLPIRFFDGNSPFFYFLGLINWRVRILRQPSELFNKADRYARVGIGNLISVEEQEKFGDIQTFGRYLRKCVYEMPIPSDFIPKNQLLQPV